MHFEEVFIIIIIVVIIIVVILQMRRLGFREEIGRASCRERV